ILAGGRGNVTGRTGNIAFRRGLNPRSCRAGAAGSGRESRAPNRAHAPPIGVTTLPVPPHSGQSLPSTLPVPPHLEQMFSPEPGVPGGTASGFAFSVISLAPVPEGQMPFARPTDARPGWFLARI